jgi:hypothetical protein
MPIAFVEMERSRFRWTESIRGRCWLEHDGDEDLEYVNSQNEGSQPVFTLTDVETGEVFQHANPPSPWGEVLNVRLAPGETLETKFASSDRFPFPAPGKYDLRVRYEWFSQGERTGVESNSLLLEIGPAEPRAFTIETGSGAAGAALVYCAWINEEENGQAGLWLSTFSASWRSKFTDSRHIATVPPDVQPVLSVPANTSPQSQYIAWIQGSTLGYVVHKQGAATQRFQALDSEGWRIVAPLIADARKPGADALLIRPGNDFWEMRVAALGGLQVSRSDMKVIGPLPEDARTVCRSDGGRRTIFVRQRVPGANGDEAEVALEISSWTAAQSPSATLLLSSWPGALIAHDVGLTSDDWLFGAVLLRQEGKGEIEYLVRTWNIPPHGEFREGIRIRLRMQKEDRIRTATMRVNPDGDPVVLVKLEDGRAFLGGASGALEELRPELASQGHVDILFVERTQPVLLYAARHCGWRIGFFGEPIRFVPAASA